MIYRGSYRCLARLGYGLALLALLALTGCGGTKTGMVSGTVTLDGKPVPTATVSFIAADGKAYTGISGDDGAYTVDKVPVGAAKITVFTTKPMKSMGGMPGVKGGTANMPGMSAPSAAHVDVPESYNKADSSGLTYTVTSGQQTYPIELKSKK